MKYTASSCNNNQCITQNVYCFSNVVVIELSMSDWVTGVQEAVEGALQALKDQDRESTESMQIILLNVM